ncbi:hypothetical protein IEI94_06665 [Halomonas sp. ML-15]|uniref:hypothetical protein n=1 Tax=Halomonas sp. ML-15 TaxID=2773305 RepID=UPI0017467A9B|nr:hypothetical protein [Halomonas sp. ML-15]MBD3895530.1 hypothetical protein [Halomonas sp. ML-15]
MQQGKWRYGWWLPLVLLAGCATGPAMLPSQTAEVPAECRWALGTDDRTAVTRAAVDVLEREGYRITHTEASLGVVSGERSRVLPGYGARYDDRRSRGSGVFGSIGGGVGSGGSVSVGTGIGIGIGIGGGRAGYGGGFPADATRVERVSVVAPGEQVLVTQDSRVIDAEGAVRESRSGDATLCRAIQQAVTAGQEAP